MKNLFLHRKIQFYIVVIFLSIISISSAFIISYSYFKTSKSILEFSKGAIERAGSAIFEKISCLTHFVQRMPEGAAIFFQQPTDISPDNHYLISFLFDGLRANPNLQNYGVATPDGLMISATNLVMSHLTQSIIDPSKALPKEAVFALIVNQYPTEMWYYKDKNLNTLFSECITNATFDPVKRPWYIGAEAKKKTFWTDAYEYYPSKELGLSVAVPFIDAQGNVFAIAEGDMTLRVLSHFLSELTIGKIGNVFLLNNSGNLLAPLAGTPESSLYSIPNQAALTAYAEFSKHHQSDFVFQSDGIEYLVSIHPFPLTLDNQWYITVIVPLKSLFGIILSTQKEVILFSIAIVFISACLAFLFSKRISTPIVKLSEELNDIKEINFESDKRIHSHIKEIKLMDAAIAAMRIPLRSFGRYVPKEIIKQLISKGQPVTLGGEKKIITIFFSDIVNFIPFAETASTEDLTRLLFEYFEVLSKTILQNHGTIDKYISDSIMAFWGAPLEIENQADCACVAALLSHAHLTALNKTRKQSGEPEFLTRFGINSGEAVVGNIGTLERMNYTVIGDTVNIAARLQHLNENYRTSIIITKEVLQKLGNRFVTRPLDIIAVRGKKEKTTIYELVAASGSNPEIHPTQEQIELCTAFTEAFETFYRGEIENAKKLFQAIQDQFPDDYPTQLYLKNSVN